MTTRLSLFDSPLFLGFDQFEQTIDRMRKSGSDGYPPYNIEQISDTSLQITLAVAGFTEETLDVEIEQNQLVISGKKQADDDERVFLHRGIASRQFQRSFVLADNIEVRGAHLDNGLLHIDLERIIPESNAKKIAIKSKKGDKKLKTIDVESETEE
ncbi:MAG: Hsp20 family protein [Alphaproteobacteria bacterium]|nr:Hsp20 family protein [Alphaproteobacteria bacterium]